MTKAKAGSVKPAGLTWGDEADGLVREAVQIPSPNQDDRPEGMAVDLLVIHFISLPPGQFGGDAITALFTNTLNESAHPDFAGLSGLRVSSHFLIRRDGSLIQYVPCARRAWHAGQSRWRGRSRCNDFSIGIELEGCETQVFDAAQYETLNLLLPLLKARFPIRDVVGHEHIAPGRKNDPGPTFDWARLS
ncbi:MAG: 1,6-anhydro-N-acetylmuramyl-L-alanine amidase AmpD [Rhodocyclaceae bacterium]|nr:MAG: 1,6-anhydro-N-acetylmuramyl-L-alanine amidase AmpD [Rhodocyclaceae bacterium]